MNKPTKNNNRLNEIVKQILTTNANQVIKQSYQQQMELSLGCIK